MKRYLLFLVCSLAVLLAFRGGAETGRIEEIHAAGEVTVSVTSSRGKIAIGDRLYVRADNRIIVLMATYPMMTLVKCSVVDEYARLFPRIRKGMPVFRYAKGVEDPATWYAGKDPARGEEISIGGIDFVYVAGGTYMMGSARGDTRAMVDEVPQHRVSVDGFWIGKYEITRKQYARIMGGKAGAAGDGDLPACSVSWDDAISFCNKFSARYAQCRLPYEVEWEYACRAGTRSAYYWGSGPDGAFAWYEINSKDVPHPVGEKAPNSWGLHDMSGNAAEWCLDWYDVAYYKTSPENNPEGPPAGSFRTVRGGSCFSMGHDVRSAVRTRYKSDYRSEDLGFRIVIPSKK